MKLTIKWKNETEFGEKILSDQDVTNIGRDVQNTIHFTDKRVSRHHATISAKSGQWYLRNISSNNIVRKGGYRVDPGNEVVLRQGEIFEVGPIQFHALGKTGPQLQCTRCNHIVEDKPHGFCPWCGLSLSSAVTV